MRIGIDARWIFKKTSGIGVYTRELIRHLAAIDRRNHYVLFFSDKELPAIYSGAELFIFPTYHEGFGFPPLEAFACGVPVLSSGAGALKEVLGDGALLIDDYGAARWARAAELLINDKQVCQLFVDKGRRQVSKYSWTETARQTMALYRRIAE